MESSTRKRKLKSEDSLVVPSEISKPKKATKEKAEITKRKRAEEISIIDLDDSLDNYSEPELVDTTFELSSKTKSRPVKKSSAASKVTKKAPIKRAVKKKVITIDTDAIDAAPDVEIDIDDSVFPMWDASVVLAKLSGVSHNVAANFVQLIEDDNTLPFIARYRKSMVDNMTPEG